MIEDIEYQLVDLRDEIAAFEKENRPFPPRSGSVSKPRKSTEPETEFLHAKFAKRGQGKKIYFRFEMGEFIRQVHDGY